MKTHPIRMLKTIAGLSGLLLLIVSARAQFTFPVYEPFGEYAEGDHIGKYTATQDPFNDPAVYANWTWGNSMNTNASPLVSYTNALSYPGLAPDPNSPARGIEGVTSTSSGRSTAAPFTPQTNGITYFSFLLNLQTLPTGDRPIIGLSENNSGNSAQPNNGISVWVSPTGQLKFDKRVSTTPMPFTNTSPALALGSTYLVVLAYNYTNGQLSLWLNPTVLGNNANIPAPTMWTTNVFNPPNPATLQSIVLYYPTGGAILSSNQFDELRVDNNWAGVTPVGCSPGSTYTVTGGGTGCPGSGFAVGLNGSDSGVNYLLYTNSAFSGQVISGTGSAVSFGSQSVSGMYNVLASNTTTTCVGWMSGSATISVLASPAIVTPPVAAIVATNGVGVFSVIATGDGLGYQWYRNGAGLTDGGHISGSQTANLVISPATMAETATQPNGYYVIITNNCGYSVISITNGLTLDQAANLTWVGNATNNLWNVGLATNWNSGSTLVAFNSGDNVTFDGTAATNVVNFANSYLAPGNIHVNSSGNYTFNGSGSIVGTNSLVKDGAGTLTNSLASSYTGGTVINAGPICIAGGARALTALGSGTVALSGGTLQFSTGLGFNGPDVGFGNNINVASPSTIEMDATGSQACVLMGNLTGTPGTTLTISEPSASGVGRLRLYGTFTNSLNIVLSSGGPPNGQATTLQLAPYNTNASQVFNGVISGDGQVISRNSGGDVTFNAQNLFTGSRPFAPNYSFVLSAGSVGLGVDSISTSPPNVDSGPLGVGTVLLTAETSSTANSGSATLFASGGPHTLHNPLQYLQGTNFFTFIIGGSNNLTLAGALNLVALDGTFTNRLIRVDNIALTTISGVIDDAGMGCPLGKSGPGTLVLSAVNTYVGPTSVTNGTLLINGQIGTNTVAVTNGMLGGSGTILGPVTVLAAGTLAPGTDAIGTLTINNSFTNYGNLFFKVNKALSPSQSNDMASVSGTLLNVGTGTLTVSNAGPALTVGNKFKLFNKAMTGGGSLTVAGANAVWNNNLAVDGTISVASLIPPKPLITTTTLSGTNLIFSGTNGTAGNTYYVLTSTNVTTPLANWVTNLTSTFAADGTFLVTNPIVPGVPLRFYLLRVP